MNYNTLAFWAMFAVVYALYWRLGHGAQNGLLLVASYVFYGFWDYRFLFLILTSTVVDYVGGLGVAGVALSRRRLVGIGGLLTGSALLLCSNVRFGTLLPALAAMDLAAARAALPRSPHDFLIPAGTLLACLAYGRVLPWLYALPAPRRRKYFLTISMVCNLAFLAFFKYCDFFIDSFRQVVERLGLSAPRFSPLNIILPAGISFYTFQAMSYTIDIYRKDAEPTKSLRDFALFVCFFPHLVAGPIMRAHSLLPQVVNPRRLPPGAREEGALLVLLGLFKKLVIADNMAPIVNAVFLPFAMGRGADVSGAEVLVGLYAFAVQIYGDFSGYSSIARGISKFLGFELMVNFHNPYLATSPSDFWRRWHISLSSWLRDYLYIPLGGSRGGKLRTYRNLMITMVLGGLWHGANWTFVAWGFYHGTLLCGFRLLGVDDPAPGSATTRLHRIGRIVLMFHLTCLGWLLFRADSFGTVVEMARALAGRFEPTLFAAAVLVFILFHYAVVFWMEIRLDGENALDRLLRAPWAPRGMAYAYLTLMLLFFHARATSDFIYFQF